VVQTFKTFTHTRSRGAEARTFAASTAAKVPFTISFQRSVRRLCQPGRMNRNPRRFDARARHAAVTVSWLALFWSSACNTYSEELLGPPPGLRAVLTGRLPVCRVAPAAWAARGLELAVARRVGWAQRAVRVRVRVVRVRVPVPVLARPRRRGPTMRAARRRDDERWRGWTRAGDACPDDPNKLESGECGCGVPESCAELKSCARASLQLQQQRDGRCRFNRRRRTARL